MFSFTRALVAILLIASGERALATEDCDREQVAAHARREFALYGPLSRDVEYFGFIYRVGNAMHSAVTRSARCKSDICVIRIDAAGRKIPAGAVVVGEWHTHPHNGEPQLSEHDVRGAYRNRHVRCYTAFYSKPDGEIFAWSTNTMSVPVAMASRTRIGNYGELDPGVPRSHSDECLLSGCRYFS